MGLLLPEGKVFYYEIKGSRYLFCDERMKMHLIHRIDEIHQMEDWRILAFCVMDDCVYFIIEASHTSGIGGSFQEGICEEKSHYGKSLRDGRLGASLARTIQAAVRDGLSTVISEIGLKQSDIDLSAYAEQLYSMPEIVDRSRAIHRIPLESGRVGKLENYWWSSYVAYARIHEWEMVDKSLILNFFSEDSREAGKRYIQMHRQDREDKEDSTDFTHIDPER